ncbi:MAG: glycosyltransferase [Nitrososphaerota archaeon]
MKIAQINNIAGIGSIFADYQRKHGHLADVFVFNDTIYRQFGGHKLNYWSPFDRLKFYRKIKDYDLWHYHYPYGSLKKALEKRKDNRIYIKHYHGNDLRGGLEKDFCLVSTPDLLKYAPNGKWSPSPIDLEEIDATMQKTNIIINKIPRVAHYPFYRNYSGVDFYSDALSTLQRDKICETVQILDQPHADALRTLYTCDIVIGKIIPDIGWFGKFELEGMALGKPVITHVSDELYEKYEPPIYRTKKETFRKDLVTLVAETSERERLSREGQDYVKRNHAAEVVVRNMMDYYKK